MGDMDLGEVIVGVVSAFLVFLATYVSVRAPKGDKGTSPDAPAPAPAVDDKKVFEAETPDSRAFRMMLDQQTHIENLQGQVDSLVRWKEENEPRLNALVSALKDLARKFRARIDARARGEVTLPHTDEDMLEEIEALIPKEDR